MYKKYKWLCVIVSIAVWHGDLRDATTATLLNAPRDVVQDNFEGESKKFYACIAALDDVKTGSELIGLLSVPDSRWARIVHVIKAGGVTHKQTIRQLLEEIYVKSSEWKSVSKDINPHRLDANVATSLALILKSRSELCCLNFFGNYIGAVGARALIYNLNCWPQLTRIDFSWNSIGDDGSVALAEGLSYVPQLKILYLGGNSITNKGALQISMGLVSFKNWKS